MECSIQNQSILNLFIVDMVRIGGRNVDTENDLILASYLLNCRYGRTTRFNSKTKLLNFAMVTEIRDCLLMENY